MNKQLREVSKEILGEQPTGSALAMAIGVAYASERAKERYDTPDLSVDTVPEALRTFINDIVDGGSDFVEAFLDGLGIE
ncbi:hypothetical protein SEA_NANOSMITE_66 [Mycobacterium phage Nanosmite]|nr:hypothetical protein SEA_NANOSMITE_66 [Mycobacterium phage Nanosmite]